MTPLGSRCVALVFGLLLLAGAGRAGAPGPEEVAGDAAGVPAVPAIPGGPTPPPVAPAPRDPGAVWRSLRYEGSALLGSFEATLELTPAAAGWAESSQWVAELRTRMRSALLADKQTTVRAWFDPKSAGVDRFEKLKLGPGPSFKRFQFREGGVDRYRKEPELGDDPRRHESWRSEREMFLPFRPESHGCHLVSDPGALVYLVSFGPGRWERDPGACVVSGKTLYRVSIRDRGTTSRNLRYRMRGAEGGRREGRARLARYEVVGTPVAGELDEDVTRLEVLVDTETELPWKVFVREGPFEIDVQLEEAVLRGP